MSLVGPRPEVPEYVDLGSPVWREILSVRPGITDPVTLCLLNEEKLLMEIGVDREDFYRYELLPRKLQGQLEYLRTRTWRTDVGVLWNTAIQIVFRRSSKNGKAFFQHRHR